MDLLVKYSKTDLKLLVFVFIVLIISRSYVVGMPFYKQRCYNEDNSPSTCITSPVDAAKNRPIVASNTCGNPPEEFCYLGANRECSRCDSSVQNLSHPAHYMVDQDSYTDVTWWQSMSWWTSNQLGLSRMFYPLRVTITLNIGKKYLISGGIHVTFKTERPRDMIIERSSDFGKSWHVYQYYAKNCRSSYNRQADPPINRKYPFDPICSEKFWGAEPQSEGIVLFDPRTRYNPMDYFNSDVDKYLEATNIRLQLEYPGTDGEEYINSSNPLNKYFYAISDLRVDARCDCNGHARYCDTKNGKEVCDCQHFTEGDDCEKCQPLYQNRKWMAGNYTHANPCQKCNCNDHATKCQYENVIGQGVCIDCVHNTRGINCAECIEKFYHNLSEPLNSPTVCIPCDCYDFGIQDDGKCLQRATSTQQLGQCNCKPGIYGRRCDQCVPGKWGFKQEPVGTCFDCSCNMYGTLNNNQICDQYTGQCVCKNTVEGRSCDTCREGFYNFPNNVLSQCKPCPCNIGGAMPSCDRVTGLCMCKVGVTGRTCDQAKNGFFFPNFTYVIYEPEFSDSNGTFSWYFLLRNYARFFTGLGFARINAGNYIKFTFEVPATARYFTAFRYSLYQIGFYSYMLPQGRESIDWNGSTDKTLYLRNNDKVIDWRFDLKIEDPSGVSVVMYMFSIHDLELGNDKFWRSVDSIVFQKGVKYSFMMEYRKDALQAGEPWPLLLDSVLFMLDYRFSAYYTGLTTNFLKSEVEKCFLDSQKLSTTYRLLPECGSHIFTIDLLVFGQALSCNCFQPGSLKWNTCDEFGGQCMCKEGYGGRRCDQCVPGYYGNPTSGCIRCGCSSVGSLSKVCHQITGQCLCKGNAHGLKCNECLVGYFHLSASNPKGCQECFGYGHMTSCKSAIGFTRNYVISNFIGAINFDGWRLRSPFGFDQTNLLRQTSIGMEYTDQTNRHFYFDAPQKFLGDQLYSYGQKLEVKIRLSTLEERLASSQWHVRLQGNDKIALFKFMEPLSQVRHIYTIILHQEYMINTTKMSEFDFKAMLGQLRALHIGVVYFRAPTVVTLQHVKLETAKYEPTNRDVTKMLSYIEDAVCLKGYVGFSCETCAPGYSRLIPNGGPLTNCIPCECNNRSNTCDPQTGICSNCRPGTRGNYCEKCMENVLEPACDQCKPGFWGLYTQRNGCKPCNCYLPGTENGNTISCDSTTGQCVCNKTINVGGRQCSVCKENSYNISLGEELRCQECPVCYGLIENSVLEVRQEMFHVEIKLQILITTIDSMDILPFFQSINSMQLSLKNLTDRANQGKMTASGLDFLWQSLGEKILKFIDRLQDSTMKRVTAVLEVANGVFLIHNTTLFQHAKIYEFLITNFNLVNNTVRARMYQQNIALNQLKNLADEMQKYVDMVTESSNEILTKKYELKQKIQLAINAAIQAVKLAKQTRHVAFNLTGTLAPILQRGFDVQIYAQTCVDFIDVWLVNASKVLTRAQTVLQSISLTIPDHSQNIANLKEVTTSLKSKFYDFGTKLFNLQNNINAVALEITKLKTSLLETQISSAKRRSSLFYTNLLILKNKTNQAIASGLNVKTEATEMLNTVQNFMTVSTNAQNAANRALAQVDSVKKSVEAALQTAESIRMQIQGPKNTGERALILMREAEKLIDDEHRYISNLAIEAQKLEAKVNSATNLIQGQQIENYITLNVRPLLDKCKMYKSQTDAALKKSQQAFTQAEEAHSSSVATARKISLLSTNINQIQVLNTGQLDNLLTSLIRIANEYATFNLEDGIESIKSSINRQKTKLSYYRTTNLNMKTKLNVYRLLYNSLVSLSCN